MQTVFVVQQKQTILRCVNGGDKHMQKNIRPKFLFETECFLLEKNGQVRTQDLCGPGVIVTSRQVCRRNYAF